jgi:hypothetical protein
MAYHSTKNQMNKAKPKKPKKPNKKKTPKGFHRMPNGKLMKGAKHPTKKNK